MEWLSIFWVEMLPVEALAEVVETPEDMVVEAFPAEIMDPEEGQDMQ